MKYKNIKWMLGTVAVSLVLVSCGDILNAPKENQVLTGATDYTKTENMILPLLGLYGEFYDRGWEDFPLMQVRGDDVNAGGLGDQQDFAGTDNYSYNKDYWMYNSVWQNVYADMFYAHSAMEQIEKYKEVAASAQDRAKADQYIAECKVIRAFLLFNQSRLWGALLVPVSSSPSDLLVAPLTSKDDVMKGISASMDEAIPNLPDINPKDRTDVPGGITKYTALAVKALANLEIKNYQAVADAAGQVIASNKYILEPDFYNLFKFKGKLNAENILELQYSDFGKGAGDNKYYLYAFYGPQNWDPVVKDVNGGWGFFEPSQKYIKFMIDRGDETRLKTSVIFTPRGMDALKTDAKYATLPAYITNVTASGDKFTDMPREMFLSGKHYIPSNMLITGRKDYGSNKNFTCIRYAEMLLDYAEALTNGATGSVMTADQAVNAVRARVGMAALSGVTKQQVIDEKFAELAMEGPRFYDMLRYEKYDELSYEGRTFTVDKAFLPYPQNQVDLLPPLKGK